MSFVRNRGLLILGLVASIATLEALDKDKKGFKPGPASSYPHKQTNDAVTIAAKPYNTAELAAEAFEKMKPHEHGLLPVLVVVQNDSDKAVRLDAMRVEYSDSSRQRIEPTPPADVPYLIGPDRPKMTPGPIPGLGGRAKKNPLAGAQIEQRAFSAKMLPPGESAHGFFYFRTMPHSGAKLYITGLSQAGAGREILYFDIPLE